jgi:hypothetical protein
VITWHPDDTEPPQLLPDWLDELLALALLLGAAVVLTALAL